MTAAVSYAGHRLHSNISPPDAFTEEDEEEEEKEEEEAEQRIFQMSTVKFVQVHPVCGHWSFACT